MITPERWMSFAKGLHTELAKTYVRKFSEAKGKPLKPRDPIPSGVEMLRFRIADIPAFSEALNIPVEELEGMIEDGVVVVRSP